MASTFDVIVTRDTTESCTMLIEAESAEDARDKALSRARSDTDLVWEHDYTPNANKELYVTSCDRQEDIGS